MSLTAALHKLWQLSKAERLLLAEAFFWLGLTRLALLTVPFRRITPYLGVHMAETDTDIDPAAAWMAGRIGWAVRASAYHTPWKSTCLVQAVAAKGMLRRRNIPSTLYLGVAMGDDDGFQAHAWLRCGSAVLTGAQHLGRFTMITTFAEKH